MKSIILIIKGFFMGLANLIPGVSGGTIAIILGIYDKLINVISHLFKNFKDNMKFIIPICIGIVISVLTLSKVISYALGNYLFPTILFFIGAIIGGVPMLYNKIKHTKSLSCYIILLITFGFVIGITFLSGNNIVDLSSLDIFDYLKLFLVGVVASVTMVVPGISGSAMLMTLGYYEPIINIIKNLTNYSNIIHNMSVLIPFGIGIIIGIILIAKLVEYLLNKYEVKTYYAILGFVFGSAISIVLQNLLGININLIDIIIGIVLFIIGFIIAYKLGDK